MQTDALGRVHLVTRLFCRIALLLTLYRWVHCMSTRRGGFYWSAHDTIFHCWYLLMETECPICLEPLTGTVVFMGCCRKQVHIQCYVPKCPMCRADLPIPTHAVNQVIVPVPFAIPSPQVPRWRIVLENTIILVGMGGIVAYLFSSQYK